MKLKYLFNFKVFARFFLFSTIFFLPVVCGPDQHLHAATKNSHNNKSLDDRTLEELISTIYEEAVRQHNAPSLPDRFLSCHAALRNRVAQTRKDKIEALYAVLKWFADNIQKTQPLRSPRPDAPLINTALPDQRAPRPDAPSIDFPDPITPVAPICCDLTQVLRLLGIIRSRIGTIDESSCEETVLSILGDACNILGPDETISSALKHILNCCTSLSFSFSAVSSLLDTLTTIQAEVHATLTTLVDCCDTLESDFNQTWTILSSLSACCIATQTTITSDFNQTWTILADIKATEISTQTSLLACCTTLQSDFNQTWTILSSLSATNSALYANICTPSIIRQVDVNTVTFTISQPGRYIFGENITFNPAIQNQRAIDITTSNVTLDLLCFNLSQGNSTGTIDAIRVASGLTNVEIRNGTIRKFSRAGITIQSDCSDIIIDGVTTFSCDTRGIELLGTVASPITESVIKNYNATSCCRGPAGDIVLTISQCTDVQVSNCQLNQNGILSHNLQVVRLDSAIKCYLSNVYANDNTAGVNFSGFDLSQANLCMLDKCITQSNQAFGAASTARGFFLESSTSCTANRFTDCLAMQLTGTDGTDGFFTGTNCNDNIFIRCEASLNKSLGIANGVVHGFNVITNSRNTYIDCIARTNTAPNSTSAAPTFGAVGFTSNTCTECGLLRCLALDQSTGAGSTSVGIQVFDGTQCSIRDCQSSRHSIGFRLDPANSTDHVFSRNFAGKNTTQYSQFPVGSNQNATTISNINGSLGNPWTNVSVG